MDRKSKIVIVIIIVFAVFQFYPHFVWSENLPSPVKKKIEKGTIHILINFSSNGEAAINVKKLDFSLSEAEEFARLLSHWYSKILYLLTDPMPRIFLTKEVEFSLFNPKLLPREDVIKKVQIDDVIKLVNKLGKKQIAASIELYLRDVQYNQRVLESNFSGNLIEQHVVFSWVLILQYASQNYDSKGLSFIYDIMAETVKIYNMGLDPGSVENMVIVPNKAYFSAKEI